MKNDAISRNGRGHAAGEIEQRPDRRVAGRVHIAVGWGKIFLRGGQAGLICTHCFINADAAGVVEAAIAKSPDALGRRTGHKCSGDLRARRLTLSG